MSSQPPQPGDLVAEKYRLLRRLGEGGMGTVFEAENVLTTKRVALKWLHTTLEDSSDGRVRLLREAQAAARIKHRNVVDIYDVGFEGESMFLVMERLEGETLQALMESETLPLPSFLSLLIQALRGVAAAHREGVIHRDVKPENILLARQADEPTPTCKVLDFGVARLADDHALTRSGLAVGTPLFMSLEQLRGVRDLDGRVDVYAFGVILYSALAGVPPFDAETLPELAFKLTTSEPVPLHERVNGIPRALAQVVMRAIAKERDARTPSIDQLIAELTPFSADGGARALSHGLRATRTTQLRSTRIAGASGPYAARPSARAVAPLASSASAQPVQGAPAAASRAKRLPLLTLGAAAVAGALAVLAVQALSLRSPGASWQASRAGNGGHEPAHGAQRDELRALADSGALTVRPRAEEGAAAATSSLTGDAGLVRGAAAAADLGGASETAAQSRASAAARRSSRRASSTRAALPGRPSLITEPAGALPAAVHQAPPARASKSAAGERAAVRGPLRINEFVTAE